MRSPRTPRRGYVNAGHDLTIIVGRDGSYRRLSGQGLPSVPGTWLVDGRKSVTKPGEALLSLNRIIAALAGVTCVVEARWRSGALNTAHHAETIARHVAAVPGCVHSANSAGCHRLLKEGGAVLVSDAAELTELLTS